MTAREFVYTWDDPSKGMAGRSVAWATSESEARAWIARTWPSRHVRRIAPAAL